ncbi:MAG TPA: glycosyltransferase family 2 protein [Acidobacteriaceae bacterium]|nr:glycosyltransferase family 2 protein [Acidobacteriaceae bacterium]
MPEISVVIPALNEAENIAAVVREMPWTLIHECIVVDNGSTDATAAEALSAGARVVAAPQRGYGRACAAGAASAAGDILVFMDGDGSDVPGEMGNLLRPILAGDCDFVIGSRMRGVREPGSMQISQVFAGRLAGILLRLLYRVSYTDMGPFRAITRPAFNRLQMREQTYGWNLEMQMRAAQRGLRIREIPVSCRRRAGGVSKVSGSLSGSLRAALRITQTMFRVASTR